MVFGRSVLDHAHTFAEPLVAASSFPLYFHRPRRCVSDATAFFNTRHYPTGFPSSAQDQDAEKLAKVQDQDLDSVTLGKVGKDGESSAEDGKDAEETPAVVGKDGEPMAKSPLSTFGGWPVKVQKRSPKGNPMGTTDEVTMYAIGKINEKACNLDMDLVQANIKAATDAIAYTQIKTKGWITGGARDEALKAIALSEGKTQDFIGSAKPGADAGDKVQEGGSGTFLDEEVPTAALGSSTPKVS